MKEWEIALYTSFPLLPNGRGRVYRIPFLCWAVPLLQRFTVCSRNTQVRRRKRSEMWEVRNIWPLLMYVPQVFSDHHIHTGFLHCSADMLMCAPFSWMGSGNLSQAVALWSSSELRTGEDILRKTNKKNPPQNKTTSFLTEKHYFNKQKLHTVITQR